MQTLRTPDDRFAGLPDFPYPPQYCDLDDLDENEPGGTLRVAWVQDGPADGDPILMLHGEPSWSYLYRKIRHSASIRSSTSRPGKAAW